MKIDCLKNKLQKSVALAERITAKSLSLAVLKNILIKTKDGFLYIEATNLEVGLEIKIPAKIHAEGVIAVNPTILNGVLNNIKEDKITLIVEDNKISLITESHKTVIKGESTEDFPSLPVIDQIEEVDIKVEELVLGIKSTAFAAATSDIKPEIASIYIYENEKTLYFVATDSFRLAEKKVLLRKVKNFNPLIIPLKNALEIARVFEEEEGNIKIVSDGNQLSIFSDNVYFTTRVIDGVYPDYKQIMPTDFKLDFLIKKDELLNALKLNVIFSDKFNQVNLKVNAKENTLNINAISQDAGENTSELKITPKNKEVEEFEAYYNIRYLTDVINILNSEQVFFGASETNRPLFIKDSEDESFSYIIMPVSR